MTPLPHTDARKSSTDSFSGLYLRCFCLSDRIPRLSHALEYMAAQEVLIEPTEATGNIETPLWEEAELTAGRDRPTIRLQVSRDDGTEACLMRHEIDWFLRRLKRPLLHAGKRKVVKHLKSTRVVIAGKLPGGAQDHDSLHTHIALMNYFASRAHGLVQIDGDGFYHERKRILSMSAASNKKAVRKAPK